MRDILYCIDEEKRVCVVVLRGCAADAMGEFERYTGDSLWIPSSERFRLPDTIRGVAKCHPDDEFNAQVGSDLAFDRAYKTYKKLLRATSKSMAKYTRTRADMIDDVVENSKRFKNL